MPASIDAKPVSVQMDRLLRARLLSEFVVGHVILHLLVANYIG